MKKLYVIMICIIFSILLQAIPQINKIELNDSELFQCTNTSMDNIQFIFSLDSYNQQIINESGIDYTRISYPDEGDFIALGLPNLPRFTRYVAVPEGSNITLNYNIRSQREICDITPFPRQNLDEEYYNKNKGFVKNEEFYNGSINFPEKIVELGEPAYIRNIRVLPVTINAFQYDPGRKILIIHDQIDVSIISTNGREIQGKISRFFEPVYRSLILNYDEIIIRNSEYQKPSYLIVYPDTDSDAFLQYMQEFIDWKHQKGFEVTAVSLNEIGSDIESILSYTRNAYNNWENPPEFLCIIGDAGGNFFVPTAYLDGGFYNGEGDHYFSLMDTDDYLADIIVGRLSFNTLLEFMTIISKIFHYEKEPYIDTTEWYENVLLVGDPTDSGPSTISTCQFVKQEMENFNSNYSFNEVYNGNYSQEIAGSINSGVSYFHYRGFANMSGWFESNVNSLNNGFMLPVVTHITCVTGDFSGTTDCRSEAFLKYGSPNTPKGAIAAIGTATGNTHTCFNNIVSGSIFSSIFSEGIYQIGTALTNAKYILHQNYPNNPANHTLQFSYWNNLMGDPALEVWTGVPQPMNVIYNEAVDIGMNTLEVTVQNSDGTPLENAWVCLVLGDDDLFASEFTAADGKVYLAVNTEIIGEATLTVTSHDFIPHLGSVVFAVADVNCSLLSYEINDAGGNNDNLPTAGENITLTPTIKNYGTTTANNVSLTLTCDNEFVAVTDNVISLGNIASGDSITASQDFGISLGHQLADGEVAVLLLEIQDNSGNIWIDRIEITMYGVFLYSENYIVLDDNQQFDPGEETAFYIELQNLGNIDVSSVTAILSSNDESIDVVDADGFFGPIASTQTGNNSNDSWTINISNRVLQGQSFSMNLYLTTAAGYEQNLPFNITVGEIGINDPFGPDAFGYVCYDSDDTEYLDAPEYLWMEIDPDLGGSGIELDLTDSGNTGMVEVVDLPFNMYFYDEVYNQITICTNGWIAPGAVENFEFMNWHIPGPIGPSPIIAPFWDDLIVYPGDISYYYSASSGVFVVEWNNVMNEYNMQPETFQIIIYDLAGYPTTNQNNKILFQYNEVHNVDVGSYGSAYVAHGQYATVGIESHNSNYGLEYTYNNVYPIGAKPLENEMAILFTGIPLQIDEPYLFANGVQIVTDSSNNNQADNNDALGINIALNNLGGNPATNVTAILSTESAYVNITASEVNYPDIGGGQSENGLTTLELEIAGDCSDGYTIEFNLAITADGYNWDQVVLINVNAPIIEIISSEIIGSPDYMLDPGETADVNLILKNMGGGALNQGVVSVDFISEYVILNSISGNPGYLQPDEEAVIIINLTASENAPIQHQMVSEWQISDDNGYETTTNYSFYISQIPVDYTQEFDGLIIGWEFTGGQWVVHNGDFAGGTAPELIYLSPGVEDDENRAISPEFNTLGSEELVLNFMTIMQINGSLQPCIEVTHDGLNWITVWEPEFSFINGYQEVTISTLDVGYENFRFAFSLIGQSNTNDAWVIDNVQLHEVMIVPHNTIYGNIELNGDINGVANTLITNGNEVARIAEDGSYFLSVSSGSHILSCFLPGYILQQSEEISFDGVWQSTQINFTLEEVTSDYAPHNLTATGGANYVDLNWQIPGTPENFQFPGNFQFVSMEEFQGRSLTGYKIYRDNVLIYFIDDIAVSSFHDADLLQQTYIYYVTAMFNDVESAPSNIVEVMVQLPPPSSIIAHPTPNNEHVYVSWTAPEGTMDVSNYRLYRNGELIYEQINNSYLDVNLPPGIYTYGVSAVYGTQESSVIEATVDLVSGEISEIPAVTELTGNFPNPFNPNTKIKFGLKEAGDTELIIFNIKGQIIKTLVKKHLKAGYYKLEWNGKDDFGKPTGSGIYFYRMKSGKYSNTKKMILLK